MILKKYKNKYKMLSIRSKFCQQPRMGNQLSHVLAFKDKGYLAYSKNTMSKAAHDQLSKSSPKHTFLPGTRKKQEQQTA